MNGPLTIPPERLMESVDAVCLVFAEENGNALKAMPSSMLGQPDQPEALLDFTRFEIEEAERFLIRCGLIRKIPDDRPSAH